MTYDNSAVTMTTGSWGYILGGGSTWHPANDTYGFPGYPCQVAGQLTEFKVMLYGKVADACTSAKFKILRPNGSNWDVIYDEDVTTEANANAPAVNGRYLMDLTTWLTTNTITVAVGDIFGLYMASSTNNPYIMGYNGSGENNVGCVISKNEDVTGNDNNILADNHPDNQPGFSATVSNSDTYMVENDNGGSGWSDGDIADVVACTDAPYYIILKNIAVPDGEDLDITLNYTNTTTVDQSVADETITLCFDGGANNNRITRDAFSNYETVDDPGGLDDGKYHTDLHIWIDPVNNDVEYIMCNYIDGQGAEGDKDIQHVSLTGRSPASLTANILRRANFSQNTGTAATCDSIIVCRKPVVVGADSFVSQHSATSLGTRLAHIGWELDASGIFSEQRYIINAGITGNSITKDSSGNCTAFKTRWNDTTAALRHDIVAYRDVIQVLVVNGANDAGTIGSNAEAYERATQLLGDVGKIVSEAIMDGDAYGGRNDYVLVGPIGDPSGLTSAPRQVYYDKLNLGMKYLALTANVPFVDLLSHFRASGDDLFASDSNSHPSDAGDLYIAQQIASAYENNSVPGEWASQSTIETLIQTVLETNNLDHVANATGQVDLVDAPNSTAVTAIITALKAATGFTAGGTLTYAEVIKIIAASVAGDVQDKTDSTTTQDVLDADDGSTVVAEITPSATTPYRSVTLS